MTQSVISLALVLIPGNPASSAGGSGSSVVVDWGPTVFGGLSQTPTVGAAGTAVGTPGGVGVTIGRVPLEPLHWAQTQPSGGAQISVAVGKTHAIKALSVPSGWVENAPQQVATEWEAPESFTPVRASGVNAVLRGVDVSGGGQHAAGFVHKYGFRYKVMLRPPFGG